MSLRVVEHRLDCGFDPRGVEPVQIEHALRGASGAVRILQELGLELFRLRRWALIVFGSEHRIGELLVKLRERVAGEV